MPLVIGDIWDPLYYGTSNVTELQGILSRDKSWISPEPALYHESRMGKIIVTMIYIKREGELDHQTALKRP